MSIYKLRTHILRIFYIFCALDKLKMCLIYQENGRNMLGEKIRQMEELLKEVKESYGNRLVQVSSFGAEDMVISHVALRNSIEIPIVSIDTGRLHEETHNFIHRAGSVYGLKIRIVFPDSQELEKLLWNKGTNSFYASVANREECCFIRKVHPLNRALAGYDAWISGIRADQTVNRKSASVIEKNFDSSDRTKINPLLYWTRSDVWEYIEKYGVIFNELYDRGFASIGCAPCTRPIKEGESERDGRWWWENGQKECGINVRQ